MSNEVYRENGSTSRLTFNAAPDLEIVETGLAAGQEGPAVLGSSLVSGNLKETSSV